MVAEWQKMETGARLNMASATTSLFSSMLGIAMKPTVGLVTWIILAIAVFWRCRRLGSKPGGNAWQGSHFLRQ
jgi:hypothetical protein